MKAGRPVALVRYEDDHIETAVAKIAEMNGNSRQGYHVRVTAGWPPVMAAMLPVGESRPRPHREPVSKPPKEPKERAPRERLVAVELVPENETSGACAARLLATRTVDEVVREVLDSNRYPWPMLLGSVLELAPNLRERFGLGP